MTSQHKLVAGTVAVAILAGGGAALAAVELSSSSSNAATPAVTAPFGGNDATGSYGLGGGRLGGRGLGGGLGPGDAGGFRDGDGGGFFGGRGLLGSGLAAAASYLGVSATTLRSDLANGQTLAQVAKAQGKTVDGLVAVMVAAQKQTFDTAVSSGSLTQAQAQRIEANLQTIVTQLVNGVRPRRPYGGGGFGGGLGGAPSGPGRGSGSGMGSFGGTSTTA